MPIIAEVNTWNYSHVLLLMMDVIICPHALSLMELLHIRHSLIAEDWKQIKGAVVITIKTNGSIEQLKGNKSVNSPVKPRASDSLRACTIHQFKALKCPH